MEGGGQLSDNEAVSSCSRLQPLPFLDDGKDRLYGVGKHWNAIAIQMPIDETTADVTILQQERFRASPPTVLPTDLVFDILYHTMKQ